MENIPRNNTVINIDKVKKCQKLNIQQKDLIKWKKMLVFVFKITKVLFSPEKIS